MQKVKLTGMQHLEPVDVKTSTDVASTLSTLGFTVKKAEGAEGQFRKADLALIQFRVNTVAVGSGTLTTAKGIQFAAGEILLLETEREITDIKFISAVAGVHGTIHAQIGYSN
ncbi:MAG: hypothetical protein GWP19_03790 [Planctomycetia bacterium]|nr:hypothetical protein [Planctomycetia bacterium]